jgi:hypothetical protein
MSNYTERELQQKPRNYLPVSTGVEERMIFTGGRNFAELEQLVNIEGLGLFIYNSDNFICDSTLSLLALIEYLESSSPELSAKLGISTRTQYHPEGKGLYLPDSKGFKGQQSPLTYHWSITKVGIGIEGSGLVYNKENGIAFVAHEDGGKMVVDRLADAKIFKPPLDYFSSEQRKEIDLATKQLQTSFQLNLEMLMAAASRNSLPCMGGLPAHTLSVGTYTTLFGQSDPS